MPDETMSEREAFEAWAKLNGARPSSFDRNMPDGSYNDPRNHEWWRAWQAATKASAERIAALEAAVAERDALLVEARAGLVRFATMYEMAPADIVSLLARIDQLKGCR